MSGDPDVTALLLAWGQGEDAARSQLVDAVYDELRRVAQRRLRAERANHSLTPTALVHEAYLRLVDQRRVQWRNRAQFFAIAARLMRRILVDRARARAAAKRDGGQTIALDERQGQLVELRFFAGFTVEETAVALDVAPITVKRDWALARAWLFRELQGSNA